VSQASARLVSPSYAFPVSCQGRGCELERSCLRSHIPNERLSLAENRLGMLHEGDLLGDLVFAGWPIPIGAPRGSGDRRCHSGVFTLPQFLRCRLGDYGDNRCGRSIAKLTGDDDRADDCG
jgi:hypothetical protein